SLLSGPPPLGPGAAPAHRLAAFYAAMVDLLETHSHLVLGAESGGARFETGAYGFWYAHLRALLAEARTPQPDSLVDILLAPLSADVYVQQRSKGLSPGQIKDALSHLAHGVLK
ncbi:TetR/AcrR family transcriptional regulator, partial [Nocardia gipuzkoensis]